MLNIEGKRMVHEASQDHIKMASDGLTQYLERTQASFFTKSMVDSLIKALKDKNDLATVLFEENDKLNEMLKAESK